jgi:hypothetical protein
MCKKDARSSTRHPIAVEAVCRTAAAKHSAIVSNLSSDGCCLTNDWPQLNPGQHITVRIGDLDGLSAQVRCVEGLRAGVVFDRSLYGPVLDHLVRQHGLIAAMTIDSDNGCAKDSTDEST